MEVITMNGKGDKQKVTDISAALAAELIRKQLEAGVEVSIPSLGITIKQGGVYQPPPRKRRRDMADVKSYPIQIDKYGNLCHARMDARSTRVVELSDYDELRAEITRLRQERDEARAALRAEIAAAQAKRAECQRQVMALPGVIPNAVSTPLAESVRLKGYIAGLLKAVDLLEQAT